MNNKSRDKSNNKRRNVKTKSEVTKSTTNIVNTKKKILSMPWRIITSIILISFSSVGIISVFNYISSGEVDQSALTDPVNEHTSNVFGKFGAYMSDVLVSDFSGYMTIFYFIFIMIFGIGMITKHRLFTFFNVVKYLFYTIFYSTWGAVLLSTIENIIHKDNIFGYGWGGQLGFNLRCILTEQVGFGGLILALIVSLIIMLLFSSSKFVAIVENTSMQKTDTQDDGIEDDVTTEDRKDGGKSFFSIFKSRKTDAIDTADTEDVSEDENDIVDEEYHSEETTTTVVGENKEPEKPKSYTTSGGIIIEKAPEAERASAEELEKDSTSKGLGMKFYKKPSVDILKSYPEVKTNPSEIEENQRKIVETLKTFRINVTTNKATIGPTVTLYEVVPNSGVKVESILNSQANLSMALKSEGVRIVPMPENGFVGIEVPNSTPQIVSMKSILVSQRFAKAKEKMQLPVGIGKSITNEPYIFDLAKTPHLLVAGATGQGKSVGLNAIITSLLYSKTPDELKFVLVDPKMLEFAAYEDLKNHFLACIPNTDNPIVTDMDLVVPTLNSVCIEMDERYKLLAQAKVKNLREYNQAIDDGKLSKLEHKKLPYIVIVIDEFADLIMTSGKEVETPIARIAQKARAAGIHMIIATQRPSTKVITGLIKSNFPARMSFKVVQANDSRIILDNNGAENLIGRGDLLFSQGSDIVRLQCAFMDNDETDKLVQHISMQESDGMPFMLPEVEIESEQSSKTFDVRQKDSLFEEAARLIVETGVGSTSNIQRRLNIGFNRAGRIMDQLEGAGIVGPQIGSKPRELKINDILHLEEILKTMK